VSGEAAARGRLPCGLTTSWPSWINVENFSAFHNLPLATRGNGFGGLDAELTFNNPIVVRHIRNCGMADHESVRL
jgi:hypothetical protein